MTSAETKKNTSQVAHQAGAYMCFQFLYHEVTRNISMPLGWDGLPPSLQSVGTHLNTLEEKDCESEVPSPRTQHNVPN